MSESSTQTFQLSQQLNRLIIYLFTRQTSAFVIILGRRDTGKTNFALLLTEILHKTGQFKHFASNIRIYENTINMQHITNLPDLTEWAEINSGKKLYILDEAGKAFRRRTPMAKLNIELMDKLQILRKYKLSFIFVTPHEKYIDGASLGSDVLDGVFLKPYFKNRKIALYEDKLETFDFTLRDIPATSIKYDTWDIAPFTLKRPIEKPDFKDSTLSALWEWSHGKTIKDLGLHSQQLNRMTRSFVKDVLEKSYHKSQD